MEKRALQAIQYGMYIATTTDQYQQKYGCVLNTLTQVSSAPVQICFHLNKENETTKQLLKSKKVALSILSTKTDPNTISIFGFQSSKNIDKFKEISYEMINGLPVLKEKIVAWILGDVIKTVEMGSHITFFVEVKDSAFKEDLDAMTYDFYHQVIKGKAPKKAPTYVEEEKEEDTYVCDVCGYRIKGKPKEGFVCPICGMPMNHFRKQS